MLTRVKNMPEQVCVCEHKFALMCIHLNFCTLYTLQLYISLLIEIHFNNLPNNKISQKKPTKPLELSVEKSFQKLPQAYALRIWEMTCTRVFHQICWLYN